jgi:glycosyltransferase involved in cell wall biosynthesis
MKIGYVMQEGGPDVRSIPRTGPANHVFKIFEELKRRGHDIRFLARYNGVIWKSDDLVTFHPVVVKRCDTGPFRVVERFVRGVQSRLSLPYWNFFESLRFAEACRQELGDCEILYERMGWMGYGASLWARWSGTHLIIEVNNGDFVTELKMLKVPLSGFQRWLSLRLMGGVVRRSRFVIATGDGHRERFIVFWKAEENKVVTIENGTDLVGLLDRRDLVAFKPNEGRSRPVTIVFVGAFEPWHGVLKLLTAIKQVTAVQSNVSLVLIGSGTLASEIRRFIDEHRLHDVVKMTGQLGIDDVARQLASADIGVAPYCGWMEFSGLKLFDYKAAGLAIVASGQNGQPRTLTHGRTALIVPPCDESALAHGLLALIGDEEMRRTMGRNARDEAEQRHTWQHTVQEIEQVFGTVMNQH